MRDCNLPIGWRPGLLEPGGDEALYHLLDPGVVMLAYPLVGIDYIFEPAVLARQVVLLTDI